MKTDLPDSETGGARRSGLEPFLAELLSEQQRLDTPVARFSSAHDAGIENASSGVHAQLLPLSAPGPGEQYAFEVDLDACSGCKSCVAACHSLNGLDETETWRDVGQLVSSDARHPFTQTITSACHHCADPACLNGCPVLAYEKDPITGIVRHLDDQCIGCSYCVLKCPYDVPKYSARLGIVRKCDLCHGRLAHGEAPACAQACPTQAIRIVTVSRATPDTSHFLAAAPDPAYTQPTTRYVTKRNIPATAVAADAETLRVQPAHWPLVALLTLMPLAIGCSVGAAGFFILGANAAAARLSVLAGIAGAAGLGFSVGHLGQPTRAWRVMLGLRTSWLSREAVVLGAWFGLAAATAVLALSRPAGMRLTQVVGLAAAAVGVLGLFCSVMIYVDTRRQFWRRRHTFPRFFGSALVLGLAAVPACTSAGTAASTAAALLVVALIAKLLCESAAVATLARADEPSGPELRTARLLIGPLRSTNELRVTLALAAGLLAYGVAAGALHGLLVGSLLLGITATGEFLERSLFFRAVDAPKMPGVPA